MKNKNEIEQQLDQKEFENDLDRDLSLQYRKIEVEEKFNRDTNKYVMALLHFSSTFIFFELLYLLLKWNINYFTLGFTLEFFQSLDIFIHIAILALSVSAMIRKRSAVDVIVDRWPF